MFGFLLQLKLKERNLSHQYEKDNEYDRPYKLKMSNNETKKKEKSTH